MNSSLNNLYQQFCDDTKISFYLNISAIVLIFIFLLREKKSNIARTIIIIIFGICLLINIKSSYSLLDWKNISNLFLNSSLAEVRNNILLNLLYCIVVFVFIIYLIGGLI